MGTLDPMLEQFPGIKSEPYFPRMVGSSEELAAPSPVTQDVSRTGRHPSTLHPQELHPWWERLAESDPAVGLGIQTLITYGETN